MTKQISGVEGVAIQFSDNIWTFDDNYVSNKSGQILITNITGGGEEETEIEVWSIPDDYEIEETIYNLAIDHKEQAVLEIRLIHKKGSLNIETNSSGTFEIYNSSFELVGTYNTEDNQIFIENIATGIYLLKQVKVEEGYYEIEDIVFEVMENDVTNLVITNETIPFTDSSDEGKEEQEETKEIEEVILQTEIEVTEQDTEQENPQIATSEEESIETDISEEITTLPRTGEDYFNIKVYIFNLIISSIAGYMCIATCKGKILLKNNTN